MTISSVPAARPAASTGRYERAFAASAERGGYLTVPFFMVGDPNPEAFLALVDAAVEAGADALELGIPFSDPVADGPAVQGAAMRARAAGVDKSKAFDLMAQLRQRHPEVPVGLLVYANLVWTPSPDAFFRRCAEAGVDSVLTADVPVHHIAPIRDAASAHGVQTVLIAPSNATDEDVRLIATLSEGYVYFVSRSGVTGTDKAAGTPSPVVMAALKKYGAPPTLLGFGISRPEHVRAALAAGAAGVISGSAVSTAIADNPDLPDAVAAVQALVRLLSQVEQG
jgi:tryptophan synthase alpha chain